MTTTSGRSCTAKVTASAPLTAWPTNSISLRVVSTVPFPALRLDDHRLSIRESYWTSNHPPDFFSGRTRYGNAHGGSFLRFGLEYSYRPQLLLARALWLNLIQSQPGPVQNPYRRPRLREQRRGLRPITTPPQKEALACRNELFSASCAILNSSVFHSDG